MGRAVHGIPSMHLLCCCLGMLLCSLGILRCSQGMLLYFIGRSHGLQLQCMIHVNVRWPVFTSCLNSLSCNSCELLRPDGAL